MKISLDWLRDYVELPANVTVHDIATDLTMTTVEVEQVVDLSGPLKGIVVGKVIQVSAVSAATGLMHLTCEVGGGRRLSIVSSAPVSPGTLLPIALPGAELRRYGDKPTTVKPMAVEGITSEAVCCGASELGLQELFPSAPENGLLDLAGINATPGQALSSAIGWDDTILEIDNKSLTHRPDLWGHYGIARELAAVYGCTLRPLPVGSDPEALEGVVGAVDRELCRRFTITKISRVNARESPLWLRSRLVRVGCRPINVIVDLTNYTMFATGQPVHAYDSERIRPPFGVTSRAPGETFRLLDGRQLEPVAPVPVVIDSEGAVALAGVMGGAATAVQPSTKDIYLEIATYEPVPVRRTSLSLGVRTDGSSRFEKGIDTQRVETARQLYVQLLRQELPDALVVGFQDSVLRATSQNVITCENDFLTRRLGTTLPTKEIGSLLSSVGFEVAIEATRMRVTVPSWRSTGDVSLAQDLVEEVARLRRYDRFDFVPPQVTLVGKSITREASVERKLKEILAFTGGMQEVACYPWVKDRYLEAAGCSTTSTIKLANAPGTDQASLAPSHVPNLLESIVVNQRHYQEFRIVLSGPVFPGDQWIAPDAQQERLPKQERRIAGALVGSDAQSIFREGKGLLEAMFRAAHVPFAGFRADAVAAWAESGARLGISSGDTVVGVMGLVTNRARRLAGIKRDAVVIFELVIDALAPLPSRDNTFAQLAEHPEVDVDISLTYAEGVPWARIEHSARGVDRLVRQVALIDLYRGQGVPEQRKAITLRLRLGAGDRTLTLEEAGAVRARVIHELKSVLGAQDRFS